MGIYMTSKAQRLSGLAKELDALAAASSSTLIVYEYTATAGQTVFSGADNNGLTLNYIAGNTLVVYNEGVLQKTVDYATTSASVLTLTSGAEVGALVRMYAFGTFAVANVYTKPESDTIITNLALKSASKADIIGTVSQSGGVPTGAVIEYTTDGAGSTCTRFADGTQVCTYRFRSPTVYALDVAVGPMWRTRDTAILVSGVNYLKAFVGELPKLSYTVRMDSWYGFPGLVAGTRTLTAWVPAHVITLASVSTTLEIDCIAWGRWF
jgi:hypothetical protein